MSNNLIETIQINLAYPALKKIDPNLQDVKEIKESVYGDEQLAQAAIPAILAGLYKLSRDDEGSLRIINSGPAADGLALLFPDNRTQLVENVAQYARVPATEAATHLHKIAIEAIRLAKEIAGENADPVKLKSYLNDQRHSILVYLPAELDLGDILNDETLDDRTNKMEGPISNLMHKIENKLSQGGE